MGGPKSTGANGFGPYVPSEPMGMTPSPTTRALTELAESLSPLERELLLGESEGWGSWMFECGAGLCAKGLGRRQNGSIYFDTPLAKQVAAALRAKTIKEQPHD